MTYMLDSNLSIALIRNKPPSVLHKLNEVKRDGIAISSITLAELEHGVAISAHMQKNADALAQILTFLDVLPFDAMAAYHYGLIRADLQRKSQLIGPLDMLIAGQARATGLILVTNNTREFSRVDGLILVDWMT